MAISMLDSRLFRNIFGTQEIRDVFADNAYTQFMIETETALARAQSTVGIIPAEAGRVITEASKKVDIE
jgi:3-carboxy-cis,cis-muconate cycloisomerase